MNTYHFICTITDSINKFQVIGSTYTDQTTPIKAKKHFLKDPFVKRHLGNKRYQIEMRQNVILLQDSFDFLKKWKKKK